MRTLSGDRPALSAILYATFPGLQGEELAAAAALYCSPPRRRPANVAQPSVHLPSNRTLLWQWDVSFCAGITGDDPVKCGKMGGGPMIGISPTLSRDVTNALIAAARCGTDSLAAGSDVGHDRNQCRSFFCNKRRRAYRNCIHSAPVYAHAGRGHPDL